MLQVSAVPDPDGTGTFVVTAYDLKRQAADGFQATTTEAWTMKKQAKIRRRARQPLNKYPRGWNRQKVQDLIDYYENQTEDEAVAEAEAAFNDPRQTVVLVPTALLPKVHKLLSSYSTRRRASA